MPCANTGPIGFICLERQVASQTQPDSAVDKTWVWKKIQDIKRTPTPQPPPEKKKKRKKGKAVCQNHLISFPRFGINSPRHLLDPNSCYLPVRHYQRNTHACHVPCEMTPNLAVQGTCVPPRSNAVLRTPRGDEVTRYHQYGMVRFIRAGEYHYATWLYPVWISV